MKSSALPGIPQPEGTGGLTMIPDPQFLTKLPPLKGRVATRRGLNRSEPSLDVRYNNIDSG